MKKLLWVNKQDDGYSLAGVLIIFMVAAILGMSIVALSINVMKISNKEHDDQSAYYIAESGTTYKTTQLETLVESATVATEEFIVDEIKNPDKSYKYAGMSEEAIDEIIITFFFDRLEGYDEFYEQTPYDKFEKIKGNQPLTNISLELDPSYGPGDNPKVYTIISEGEIGDEKRLVQLPVEIEWFKDPEFALISAEDIIVQGSGLNYDDTVRGIDGDIGSIGGNIRFPSQNGQYFDGKAFVDNPEDETRVTGTDYIVNQSFNKDGDVYPINEETRIPNLPKFPAFPEGYNVPENEVWNGAHVIENGDFKVNVPALDNYVLEMDENLEFYNFTVNGYRHLTIDTKGEDREIVAKNFYFEAGYIHVIGGGTLTIYIDNKFTLTGGTIRFGDETNVDDIFIYYAGDNDLSLLGDQKVYASIYALHSNFDFNEGGGFYGNILTGGNSIRISGGAQGQAQLVLAPNARLVQKNGDFRGTIAAKEITVSGGTTKYEKIDATGPFSLEEIMKDSANEGNTFMQRPAPSFDKKPVREK